MNTQRIADVARAQSEIDSGNNQISDGESQKRDGQSMIEEADRQIAQANRDVRDAEMLMALVPGVQSDASGITEQNVAEMQARLSATVGRMPPYASERDVVSTLSRIHALLDDMNRPARPAGWHEPASLAQN